MNTEHKNTLESYPLVPYGEHPHVKGLQRVDHAVAQALVDDFYSLRGRLARRFGGLPVYIGHPDDPAFAGQPGHDDTRAHGWVHGLEARADGLYIIVKWAQSGRDLLAQAHYKYLSPRWAMQPVGPGVFTPTRLLSVGLTNTPNILGEPVANAAEPTAMVGAAMELTDEIGGSDDPERWFRLAEDAHAAREAAEAHARELEARLARFEVPAANTTRRPLKTGAITANLGQRKPASGSRQLLDAVQARMAETGEDYQSAWLAVRP